MQSSKVVFLFFFFDFFRKVMRRGVLMTMLQQAAVQLPMWMGKSSERYDMHKCFSVELCPFYLWLKYCSSTGWGLMLCLTSVLTIPLPGLLVQLVVSCWTAGWQGGRLWLQMAARTPSRVFKELERWYCTIFLELKILLFFSSISPTPTSTHTSFEKNRWNH